jgi:hypothetical protein
LRRMKEEFENASEIQLSEQYDKESDIYYVTVMTGEPSICVEVDDRLLIENGIFSGMPTGFRILGFSKIKNGGDFKHIFKQLCKKSGLRREVVLKDRQQKFEEFLEKVEA